MLGVNSINKKILALITAALTIIAVLSLVYVNTLPKPISPGTNDKLINTEQPVITQPQIKEYFGNLTGATWNQTGSINSLTFEDGRVFSVDHYVRISGWNRYYNVTYQEPNILLGIQEYVPVIAFLK